jgi:hypothetical protein
VNNITETKSYFQENNYIVVRNFLSQDVSSLLYQYCMIQAQRTSFKIDIEPQLYDSDWDGTFGDSQSPNVYSLYGDPIMDSILLLSNESINNISGMNLIPNYTYWRLYEHGSDLKPHVDRPSCEISATICLGYDISNVDEHKFPNYNWAMFVETKDYSDGLPIHLNPGDMILYKGCVVKHWRERFKGLNQAQVFIHYNDANGDYGVYLDDRIYPGIPKKYERN